LSASITIGGNTATFPGLTTASIIASNNGTSSSQNHSASLLAAGWNEQLTHTVRSASTALLKDISATFGPYTVLPGDPVTPVDGYYSLSNLSGTKLAEAYMTIQTLSVTTLHMPTVNNSSPSAPVYQFQGVPASPTTVSFIDPLVAVGYDYEIG